MKIIDSPTCPFCPDTEQSIVHLFVRCSSAISFWNEFTEWYRAQCKEHSVTAFTEYEILYGVLKRLIFASNNKPPYSRRQVFLVHLR